MRLRRSSSCSSGASKRKGLTSVAVSVLLMSTSVRSQRPECGSQLGGEERGLFPRCEVTAFVDLVEVDEVGVRVLGPTSRRLILLAGKDAHGHGHGDAFGVEKATLVLPVE